jgi:hypothetical protein
MVIAREPMMVETLDPALTDGECPCQATEFMFRLEDRRRQIASREFISGSESCEATSDDHDTRAGLGSAPSIPVHGLCRPACSTR